MKIMSIRHLSMSDRSRIEVYLELGWSNSRIAKEIKFSKQAYLICQPMTP